jgi:endonuclease/exonuclease/phosphatase family metal-dependent hydrolase
MGGFAHKAAALEQLAPDIAIVSEVTRAAVESANATDAAWIGADHDKGLALFSWNGWRLEDVVGAPERHVLAAQTRRDGVTVSVVGVWPSPLRGDYVAPIDRGLRHLSGRLAGDVIVAGDFNANPIWDVNKAPPLKFATILDDLRARDIRSTWHEQSGDDHGAERTPTFFWRMNERQRFHIDYIFASAGLRRRIETVRIGAYQDWVATKLSDHAPVIADFAPHSSAG